MNVRKRAVRKQPKRVTFSEIAAARALAAARQAWIRRWREETRALAAQEIRQGSVPLGDRK